MTALGQKLNNLSQTDQHFVEQIIDQLLFMRDFSISENEYNENLSRLEKMKSDPGLFSTDAFEAIGQIRSKLNEAKG